MNPFKKQFLNFLTYSKTEQRGIVVLLLLLLTLITINLCLPLMVKHKPIDTTEFEKEIDAFLQRQNQLADSIENAKSFRYQTSNRHNVQLNPFPFDPNDLPEKDWLKMGLSKEQISVIKNYESKGGQFRSKDDLAKMYSISEEEFKILEPFIRIKIEEELPEELETLTNLKPCFFDPNKLDKEEWLEMGVREKLVNTILNYKDKGGKFFKEEDLQQIYGMSEDEYNVLQPYIRFEKDTACLSNAKADSLVLSVIDINLADTLDLQQLKGIGPSFAKRIVKYRDLLGGYFCREQLLEVYGMDEQRFSGIKDQLVCKLNETQKININAASIKEMIKHPYIEFYLAKSIIEHRDKIGEYTSVSQLKDAKLIYEELYQKIEPYICIQ